MSDWNRMNDEYGPAGAEHSSDRSNRWSSGLGDRAREGVEQATHTARDAGGRAKQGFEEYFHRHPLLMGAGALALGIAVGMILPSTRQEDRWLGEASDRVKERTRETASRVGKVARTSFEEARDTARSELEERGLDAESLREGARETAQEAREVAEKTASETRRAAEEEAERNKLR